MLTSVQAKYLYNISLTGHCIAQLISRNNIRRNQIREVKYSVYSAISLIWCHNTLCLLLRSSVNSLSKLDNTFYGENTVVKITFTLLKNRNKTEVWFYSAFDSPHFYLNINSHRAKTDIMDELTN
jgi:hypothetical protein